MQISVIIPCHNAGRWIAAALQSVALQTYQPREIIVVDDASTDGSLAQIKASGVDVKVLQVNARNAASARNEGIEAATGDWIALLDADDKWYPNHLARAAELLASSNDIAFMSNHDWIDGRDEILPMPDEFQCKLDAPNSGLDADDFFRIQKQGFHFGHSTVLYRSDRLNEVGRFDPTQKRRHDIDLWLRMIANRTFTYDTVKSAAYRADLPGSLSSDIVECDYFYMRALTKNLGHIESPLFRQHVSREARRAMGIAFVDGEPEHYARIQEHSWSHLALPYRLFYGCAKVWPWPFRALLKAKRRAALAMRSARQTKLSSKLLTGFARDAAIRGVGLALFPRRNAAYRRMLKYDPKQHCGLGVAGPKVETSSLPLDDHGFRLPDLRAEGASGLLELDLRASTMGSVFDPCLDIETSTFRGSQYFERGVTGTRYVNLTQMLRSIASDGGWVRLNGRHVSWSKASARLHLCREKVSTADRVLVIAPHPDDAEIAAFGLYADTQAHVITLTAGDASDRYHNAKQPWMSLSHGAVAKMRVLDSLAIPQLGGVPTDRVVNLCYPDGRLAEMHQDPERELRGRCDTSLDFADLRQLNNSRLVHGNAKLTWAALVSELAGIIESVRPTIVVAPHPWLDPHPDHLFSTAAVMAALEASGFTTGRMFFYTVHNRRSELWPFGPAGSGVALLPILPEDGIVGSGFYSHVLSVERQQQKFVALEAMHDVREMQWPDDPSNLSLGPRVWAEVRALAHGMGVAPTSYLRRAVRPDELFLVASFDECKALVGRATEHWNLGRLRTH
jgi:glycosyltransferase involved in cell wall biosynthesis/LmbE family N-acetylglucosaminyl deacetylase